MKFLKPESFRKTLRAKGCDARAKRDETSKQNFLKGDLNEAVLKGEREGGGVEHSRDEDVG